MHKAHLEDLGLFSKDEQRSFVFLCLPPSSLSNATKWSLPPSISLSISIENGGPPDLYCLTPQSPSGSLPLLNDPHSFLMKYNKTHVLSHCLRVVAGSWLLRMNDPAIGEMVEKLEQFHDLVLETMGECQKCDEESEMFSCSIKDEGIFLFLFFSHKNVY